MPTNALATLVSQHAHAVVRPTERSEARLTYSVSEAAALLGISRSTAYEAVRRGELRALRFGRRMVVPAAFIDQLLVGAEPAEVSEPPTGSG